MYRAARLNGMVNQSTLLFKAVIFVTIMWVVTWQIKTARYDGKNDSTLLGTGATVTEEYIFTVQLLYCTPKGFDESFGSLMGCTAFISLS